ncbi:helix-turn-helix domain-containing protein [Telluribacter sp.]|uniref:helix-turn-helix domain-containing protein n=1 Tax=Telluribacter sp. TaxID=1978767 RepID=UPI0039C9869F
MGIRQKSTLSPEGQYLLDTFTEQLERLERKLGTQTPPKKDYYRATEVCQILNISRSKFEQFKRDGLFPTHKVGGMVYVAASEIDRLLPR